MRYKHDADQPQGAASFHLMAARFRLRDLMRPPASILAEIGVRPAMTVLDLGCGPGSFSVAAAQIVGSEGAVYALDINSLAIRSVRKAAASHGLHNITAILGGDLHVIDDRSCNIALLHDVLHALNDPADVMTGLHRVLRQDGTLMVADHHMTEEEIVSAVTSGHLFRLSRELQNFRGIYCFDPVPAASGADR